MVKKLLLVLMALFSAGLQLFATAPYKADSPWNQNLLKDLNSVEKEVENGFLVEKDSMLGLVADWDSVAKVTFKLSLKSLGWDDKDLRYSTLFVSGGRLPGYVISYVDWEYGWRHMPQNHDFESIIPTGNKYDDFDVVIENNTKDTLWLKGLEARVTMGETFTLKAGDYVSNDDSLGTVSFVPGVYYKEEGARLSLKPNNGCYVYDGNETVYDSVSTSLPIIFKKYAGKVTLKYQDFGADYRLIHSGLFDTNNPNHGLYSMGVLTGYFKDTLRLQVSSRYDCAKFVGWGDGNTDEDRYITHTIADTLSPVYEIEDTYVNVMPNDRMAGYVTLDYHWRYGNSYSIDTLTKPIHVVYADSANMFTAIAKPGYKFIGWSDGSEYFNRRFNPCENYDSLVAIFVKKDSFLIEVVSADTTMGTVSGTGYYLEGESISKRAFPNEGYEFDKWVSSNSYSVYTAKGNDVITAHFKNKRPYCWIGRSRAYTNGRFNDYGNFYYDTISIDAPILVRNVRTGLSYSQFDSFQTEYGDTLIATAPKAPGFKFLCWKDSVTTNPRTYISKEGIEFEAIYEIDSNYVAPDTVRIYLISSDDSMGMASPYFSWVAVGDSIYKTAVPFAGYQFEGWISLGGYRTDVATVHDTLMAIFSVDSSYVVPDTIPEERFDSVYVNVLSSNRNYGSVTGSGWYAVGDSLRLRAVAEPGYKFIGWESFAGRTDIATVFDTIIAYFSVDSSYFEQDTVPFVKDSVFIDVMASNDSLGSVVGAGWYAKNDTIVISATPYGNAIFEGWTDGSTMRTREIACYENQKFTAIFKKTSSWSENIADDTLKADTTTSVKRLFMTIDLTSLSFNDNQMKHLTLQASIDIKKNSSCEAKVECYADAACRKLLGVLTLKSGLSDLFNGMMLFADRNKQFKPALTDSYTETSEIPEGTNFLKFILEDDDAASAEEIASEYNNLEIQIARKSYNVELFADGNIGKVYGAGEYLGGDSARIEAVPVGNYNFVCWSDGVKDAVRDIVVDDDMNLEAIFMEATDVEAEPAPLVNDIVNVYTIEGYLVKAQVRRGEALNGLNPGFYVVGNSKVRISK